MRGGDAIAERVLRRARSAARVAGDAEREARAELALAELAVVADDAARARAHLDASGALGSDHVELAACAWLVLSRAARLAGAEAPDAIASRAPSLGELLATDRGELAGDVLLELATDARARGDVATASALVRRAAEVAPAGGRLEARVELARAEDARAAGDAALARERLDAALASFARLDAPRDEGRSLLAFLDLASAGRESPASWLGRARALLGDDATHRDRLALRRGFRAHGRRLPDRALSDAVATHVDDLDASSAALGGRIATIADLADRALADAERAVRAPDAEAPLRASLERADDGARLALANVERCSRELVELVGSALVERNRMRHLIACAAALNEGRDEATFGQRVADAAASLLEADRVAVVVADASGKERVLGSFGIGPSDLARPELRGPLERARSGQRAEPAGAGDAARPEVIAVALGAGAHRGALVADKLARRGRFREQDEDLAQLLAQFATAGLARIAARDAELLAASRLRATLEAIQDGVLALDAERRVSTMNAAAARSLRAAPEAIVGKRLAEVPELEPLAAAVASPGLPDGAVVRLAHGSIVVTGRRVGAGDGGVVVTLAELERAERIAQRITGARVRYGFDDVVGRDPALRGAVHLARQASTASASVLITGESGTGKEVLAQAIHGAGPRAGEPFVGINCAALPRELLEAELFGYERGAFTGARSDGNPGKFELAGGGTILLDEIGDMPLDMQAKLLRVLEERVVVRLGGSQERPVRARVIATTHRDLEAGVAQRSFRMDLLFRLRVIAIHLPPLRERGVDLDELAQHLLSRVARAQNKQVERVAPRVLDELRAHAWPGNVRELANVIEREVTLLPASARVLERLSTPLSRRATPSFPDGLFDLGGDAPESTAPGRAIATTDETGAILPLAEVERLTFLGAYERCRGNVARAAKALGVSKVTFYAKLRQWGLHPSEGPASTRGGFDGPASSRLRSEPPPSSRMPPEPPATSTAAGSPGEGSDPEDR